MKRKTSIKKKSKTERVSRLVYRLGAGGGGVLYIRVYDFWKICIKTKTFMIFYCGINHWLRIYIYIFFSFKIYLIANIYLFYIFGTTNLMDPFLKDEFLSSALREWMVLRNRPQFTANTTIVGLKDNSAFFNISEEFKEWKKIIYFNIKNSCFSRFDACSRKLFYSVRLGTK